MQYLPLSLFLEIRSPVASLSWPQTPYIAEDDLELKKYVLIMIVQLCEYDPVQVILCMWRSEVNFWFLNSTTLRPSLSHELVHDSPFSAPLFHYSSARIIDACLHDWLSVLLPGMEFKLPSCLASSFIHWTMSGAWTSNFCFVFVCFYLHVLMFWVLGL